MNQEDREALVRVSRKMGGTARSGMGSPLQAVSRPRDDRVALAGRHTAPAGPPGGGAGDRPQRYPAPWPAVWARQTAPARPIP